MNTPAHAAINLLLLSRDPGHRKTAAIVGGALIPDLAIMGFYAWQLLRPWVIAILSVYLLYWGYVYLVWI